MKWKNLQMPKPLISDAGNNDSYGKFVLEPLERGFGATLATPLRRVLLSSLQGAAITAVRIDGVLHEFSTLPGVIEDVTEIVLNLKQVRLKLHGDGPKKGVFEMRGKGEVRAGDLNVDADAGAQPGSPRGRAQPRRRPAHGSREINGGRGYISADQHSAADRPIGVIPIDSLFSPVTKVNYTVEATRLGQRIDYDKLTLEVWTDGSIKPADAVAMAAKIPQGSLRHAGPLRRGAGPGRRARGGRGEGQDPQAARQERRGVGAVRALEQPAGAPRRSRPSVTSCRRANRRC